MERYAAVLRKFSVKNGKAYAEAELDLMGHFVYVPVVLNSEVLILEGKTRAVFFLDEYFKEAVTISVIKESEETPGLSIVDIVMSQGGDPINEELVKEINQSDRCS